MRSLQVMMLSLQAMAFVFFQVGAVIHFFSGDLQIAIVCALLALTFRLTDRQAGVLDGRR